MDHGELERVLRADGRGMTSSRLHGLMCGLVCVGGGDHDALRVFDAMAMHETAVDGQPEPELAAMVAALHDEVAGRFGAGGFEFPLLLPDDEQGIAAGTEALGEWCDGFVFGIAQGRATADGALPDTVAEVLRDMMEISRVEPGGSLPDDDLRALVELQEYVKVAAQLVFEELNPTRPSDDPH